MIRKKKNSSHTIDNNPESADSSEIALILDAAGGGEESFNELTVRYAPLLKSCVSAFASSVPSCSIDELSQEALLAFHRAVVKFDPLYGNITFGLYAKVCITNALKSEVRRLAKEAAEQVISIDSLSPEDIPFETDEEAVDARTSELRELIRNSLSDYENTVFWSYYAGISAAEIARSTGKSQKSIENAIFRIRKKLRELLK